MSSSDEGQAPGDGREAPGGHEAPRGAPLLLGIALLATLALGAWMRWALTGHVPLAGDFAHLRHAHSHLGYYGVLFPLAWLAWRSCGAPVPGRGLLALYAVAASVAVAGFVRAGYGPEAIAGSAVVGGIWLVSAWGLRRRARDPRDPLALVLPGVVLAEACVPPIAASVGEDPVLAQAWVATFLAVLLLAVVVPSALAARGVEARAAPLLVLAAALGAASLGVWPAWPARLGLLIYGAWLAWGAWRGTLPGHLRAVWVAVAVGLGAMALGLLPNNRPVVVGAIHFLVLGPVLASLAPLWLPRQPGARAWWVYHGGVALLAAPLVAQGLGMARGTATLSALGGTAVVVWWGWALLAPRR